MDKKEKKKLIEKLKKLIVRNSWKILEMKFLYYEGAKYGLEPPDDSVYDKIEDNYKKACKLLKKEPTASNHVGFPSDTPSGRLVMSKFLR